MHSPFGRQRGCFVCVLCATSGSPGAALRARALAPVLGTSQLLPAGASPARDPPRLSHRSPGRDPWPRPEPGLSARDGLSSPSANLLNRSGPAHAHRGGVAAAGAGSRRGARHRGRGHGGRVRRRGRGRGGGGVAASPRSRPTQRPPAGKRSREDLSPVASRLGSLARSGRVEGTGPPPLGSRSPRAAGPGHTGIARPAGVRNRAARSEEAQSSRPRAQPGRCPRRAQRPRLSRALGGDSVSGHAFLALILVFSSAEHN